jgi:DivIVA domain-containing protein
MVPGSHARAGSSDDSGQLPVAPPGLLKRLRQLLRPALPAPLTATSLSPPPERRGGSLVRLQAEDVRNVRFSGTTLRQGYDQDEVDSFLGRVESQLRADRSDRSAESLSAEDVVNQRFRATKFRAGYDQDEVDDFLDRIVTELRRRD